VAAFKGKRCAPLLRALPATPRPRQFTLLGAANVLELDGAARPELSLTRFMDGAARVTRFSILSADTRANIRILDVALADLGLRIRRVRRLDADTLLRLVQPVAWEIDEALHVTGLIIEDSDLRPVIGCSLQLVAEAAPRIYAVLRRENHLILT
jgi:hypothetical protein